MDNSNPSLSLREKGLQRSLIKAVTRVRARWLGQHHRPSHFLQLPAELIIAILVEVQEKHMQNMMNVDTLPWTHITQQLTTFLSICRTIRNVTLGAPEMWSQMSLSGVHAAHLQNQIDIHLDRAGDLPCTVFVDVGHNLGVALLDCDFARLANQTRNLYIRSNDITQEHYTHSMIEKPWPILERLTHSGLVEPPNHDFNWCGDVYLLSGRCDTLTSLHLIGRCTMEHVLPRLPHLVDLSLDQFHIASRYSSLRALLLHSKQLMSLQLDITGGPLDREAFVALHGPLGSRFILSDLRNVRLLGNAALLSCMLDVLPHPQDALSIVPRWIEGEVPCLSSSGLMMRVLGYIDHFADDPHATQYQVVIDQSKWQDQLSVQLIPLLHRAPNHGKVKISGQCKYDIVSQIVNRVTAIDVLVRQDDIWIKVLEAAAESLVPSAQKLYIKHWKSKKSKCMRVLENCLKRRKDQGNPFETLRVGLGYPVYYMNKGLADAWLEQGLVMVVFDPKMGEKVKARK